VVIEPTIAIPSAPFNFKRGIDAVNCNNDQLEPPTAAHSRDNLDVPTGQSVILFDRQCAGYDGKRCFLHCES
jgi:hypothetical protein